MAGAFHGVLLTRRTSKLAVHRAHTEVVAAPGLWGAIFVKRGVGHFYHTYTMYKVRAAQTKPNGSHV